MSTWLTLVVLSYPSKMRSFLSLFWQKEEEEEEEEEEENKPLLKTIFLEGKEEASDVVS